MKNSLLVKDLDYILENTAALWENLRDQRLFITGGTGFFGCWLLESFLWANERLGLNAEAVVLTRNIENFNKKCPHLVSSLALSFHEGDITNFSAPPGHFSHVIHGATEASVSLNKNNPQLMLDTIVQGTQKALTFAKECGAQHFLLTSSGAIYGKQPSDMTHVKEEYSTQLVLEPDYSAYAEGKRIAEQICSQYAEQHKINIKIARCFAFIGPYLPLDSHFAIGNFIRDGLCNKVISVQSDGTSHRSYLYAADLAIWLWTILFRGESMRPYNVGSDVSYRIKDVAYQVAACFGQETSIKNQQTIPTQPPERYVPDVSRAGSELGLKPKIGLVEAIQLTKEWYSIPYLDG